MELLRKPQAKRTAVIRCERERLVLELPLQVCSSRAGEVICKREMLLQRISQQGVKLPPPLEQGIRKALETVEDYTDKTRLASFSITVPYDHGTPSVKRIAAAMELKSALIEIDDFEVEIEGTDTVVKYALAAAA